MPRLPQPGSDNGTWGEILNEFLLESHVPDGSLKPDSVTEDVIADNSVALSKIQSLGGANGIATLDSTAHVPDAQLPSRLDASSLAASTNNILTTTPSTPASTGYLSLAGTNPGNVPVAKVAGDARAAVWELVHNDTTGYLFHLLAGNSMAHDAALIGMGVDNDGIGLLIPNKKNGRAIVIDQKSTATDSYGLHATQSSATAPMLRFEMNRSDAADVMQLIAFGTPGASQRLLYVSDPTGMSGQIMASTGVLDWRRDIRIRNNPTGEVASYLTLATSTSANSANTRRSYHGAAEDFYFGATGSAGVYYPYKMAHSGSSLAFQTASNLTSADPLAPAPSEVATWTTRLSISNTNGVSLAAGMVQANTNTLGFYGATPVTRPAAVADATDATSAVTQLNALLARLRTLGLISL